MLKLIANPVFWADVKVLVPGEQKPVVIKVKFKHRSFDDQKKFINTLEGREDIDVLMDMVEDWSGVDAAFNKPNAEQLIQSYHGITLEFFKVYCEEYSKARIKN